MPFYTSPSWQYGSELRGTASESGVRVAEEHGHCLDGQSCEIPLACLLACAQAAAPCFPFSAMAIILLIYRPISRGRGGSAKAASRRRADCESGHHACG